MRLPTTTLILALLASAGSAVHAVHAVHAPPSKPGGGTLAGDRPMFVYYGGNTFPGVVAWHNASATGGVSHLSTGSGLRSYSSWYDSSSDFVWFQGGFHYPPGGSCPLGKVRVDGSQLVPHVRSLPHSDGNNLLVSEAHDLVVWECYVAAQGGVLSACWTKLSDPKAPVHTYKAADSDNELCGFALSADGRTLYTCDQIDLQWAVISVDLATAKIEQLTTTNGQGGIALNRKTNKLYVNDFPFTVVRADVYELDLSQSSPTPKKLLFSTTIDYILSLTIDEANNTLYSPIYRDVGLYQIDLGSPNPTPVHVASNLGGIDPTVELHFVPRKK